MKIYKIKSFTDPNTTYRVSHDLSQHAWSCNCPVKVLSSRLCKHIQVTSLVEEMLRKFKTTPTIIPESVVEEYVEQLVASDLCKKNETTKKKTPESDTEAVQAAF